MQTRVIKGVIGYMLEVLHGPKYPNISERVSLRSCRVPNINSRSGLRLLGSLACSTCLALGFRV